MPNTGAPIPPMEIRIHSDPAQIAPARKAIEAFCLQAGLTQSDADVVGLCVNEAVANIIRHAYAGVPDQPIVLTARATDAGVEIDLRDWGPGINPTRLPEKPRDPLTPGGLGMICMRKCLDHFVYQPQSDGMLLVMTKHRTQTLTPARPE